MASLYPALHSGKQLYTPARNPLVLPNPSLAEAVSAEWEALGTTKPDPGLLPLTSFAALTLDVMANQRESVLEELLEYGETDLLFYREDSAEELQLQQAREWQSWIQWAEKRFATEYHLAGGIMPITQPETNHAKHRAIIEKLDNWQLSCLAVVVKSTTSLLLGIAFVEGVLDAKRLYILARLEEEWNIRQWGEDAEATEKADRLRADLEAAERWRNLLVSTTNAG